MRKSLALIGLPILLGGFGLPPALSVASWALDGVSYLATGKSVTDHAISQVAQQDCALFRVVQGREVCDDVSVEGNNVPIFTASALGDQTPLVTDPYEVDLAAYDVEEPSLSASLATPSEPAFAPPEIIEIVELFGAVSVDSASDDLDLVAPASLRWQAPDAADGARFVAAVPKDRPAVAQRTLGAPERTRAGSYVAVVGSFQYADNARGLADRLADLDARVRVVETGGKTWHRVVTNAPLARVQQAGFTDAWLLKVEPGAQTHVQVAAAN